MIFDLVFYVYIITNKRNGTIYTGHTDDLGGRMEQHVHGFFDGFSKKHGLKHLVWFEPHETRQSAFERERRIKDWKRVWKLELIEKENSLWIDINQAPVWPLPDREMFPDIWKQCMDCRLDPSFTIGLSGD